MQAFQHKHTDVNKVSFQQKVRPRKHGNMPNMFTHLTCLMVFTGLTCLMVFYITQNGENLKFGHIQEPTNNFELTH